MRAYDRNNWRPPPLPRLDAFPHANMTLGRENFRRCAAHISATAAYLAVTVLELASLALCSHQPPGGLTRRVRMLSCSFFLQLGNPWGHPATIRAGNGALETLHDGVYLIPEKHDNRHVFRNDLFARRLKASESGPVDLAQKSRAGRQSQRN